MRTKLTKEQEDFIIKQYNNGVGKFAKQLARELDIYPQVVTNCLRRNGINVVKRYWHPRGEKHHCWRGGTRMVGGYLHLFRPTHPYARKDGWILRSHLIIEEGLGHHLPRGEVVHHKDGDRTNDTLGNLEVFSNNGEHLRLHNKFFSRDRMGRYDTLNHINE